jgi:hypothetical protein
VASGRELLKLQGHTGEVSSVAVTPDGRRIITGSVDGTAMVWDATSGRELRKLKGETGIRSIALTPDGKQLVTGGWATAQLWDVTSGQPLRTFKVSTVIVHSTAVTPDGKWVVAGCWQDGMTRLWDISNGQELRKFQEPVDGVTAVAVTPDSQRLITGRSDGTATVWDTASGRELLFLKGHTANVTSIALTLDGRRIITGSVDGTVRLWDAASGRELVILNGDAGPVRSVAVTPDGWRLVTGSDDGTVKIWQAASPEHTARWAKQDQEIERRRAAWQRPGAKALGFIQDWLVLGPLALKADQTAIKGLECEQLMGEASLQPQEGAHELVGGQEFTWQEHHEKEPILDFNRFVGKGRNDCVAYAVCYVSSAVEWKDLLLQVGSDDHAKVYLNGQEVYKNTRGDTLGALEPMGPVTLRKGTNLLVLKVVVKYWRDWHGCARFVDREGNPVQGLRVRLSPE